MCKLLKVKITYTYINIVNKKKALIHLLILCYGRHHSEGIILIFVIFSCDGISHIQDHYTTVDFPMVKENTITSRSKFKKKQIMFKCDFKYQ